MVTNPARTPVDSVRGFGQAVFEAAGLPREMARQVIDNLVLADLRGIESHGVTRIPVYVERLRRGIVARNPDLRAERVAPGAALVDGGNGPGAVVGNRAMTEAISLARENGVGTVLARRSNHYGIGAAYALQAVREGCIGITGSNAPLSMAVWGSREAALGTNPFAAAAPARCHPPIVLDMAASVVARGKIVEKAKRGESIPEGWGLDREGRPTTDARAAVDGVVLPFGGPKGSGFAILIDILSGVLAGAGFGSLINNLYTEFEKPQDVGHFFMALEIETFLPREAFLDRMDDFIENLKVREPAPGSEEILMPGEPEFRTEQRLLREGLLLPPNVLADLRQVGGSLGVAWPDATGDPTFS